MKDLDYIDKNRIPLYGQLGDKHNGAFELKMKGEKYFVVASDGQGWDHVSVSHKHKIPSWKVMNAVKEMFFEDDEVVMQLHPSKKDYINNHPNCLHLWRPQKKEIPQPPIYMI
ncbi:hypothetical protein WBZ18_03545 [Clostridium botulinum]|uniref:DUF7694 domain-containing protein n=1 Tax=Clostridium botulinum TaxID=1491 RepID=UPI00339D3633